MSGKAPSFNLVPVSSEDDLRPVALDPSTPLLIGRGRKGIQLTDPLVSIQHCQISWTGSMYRVTDLGSNHGTWVDEECIRDESRPIGVGTKLRMGDTSFEVKSSSVATNPLLLGVAALAVLLVGVAVLSTLWATQQEPVRPSLKWSEPIRQGGDGLPSANIVVPDGFLRKHGMDIYQLKIRRVTDFNFDGRDEVWFRHDQQELVVTFGPAGDWQELGAIPKGCRDLKSDGERMPSLDCDGVRYVLDGKTYQPVSMEGVVVWSSKGQIIEAVVEGGEKTDTNVRDVQAGKLDVQRVSIGSSRRLAGFLNDRGISGPIHYLICEGAFPGLAPQVRMQSGEIRQLSHGCLATLNLEARKTRAPEPEEKKKKRGHDDAPAKKEAETYGQPLLVAFSQSGADALARDIRRFYGGNARGAFVDPSMMRVEQLASPAGFLRGDLALNAQGTQGLTNPVADESGTLDVALPIASGNYEPSAPATGAVLLSPGELTLEMGECDLDLVIRDFYCDVAQACTEGSTFIEVWQSGCGERVKVGDASYGGGRVLLKGDDYEVIVATEVQERATGMDVLRASVNWR